MDSSRETKTRESLTLASKEEGNSLNADDLKLAEMGYKPVSLLIFSAADTRNCRGVSQ
jgi:hypothetical protein